MNKSDVIDLILELRLKLSPEGEIGEYATSHDNAENVCVLVTDELDLILKEVSHLDFESISRNSR